jgi:ATP-dependent helicase/nuclease subunit A
MVGDVKQSIYKFRGARPELFLEKLEQKRAVRVFAAPPPDVSLITLSKNFRSRACVVDAVNLFFSRLMTRESEIDYDTDAALYLGADYPEIDGMCVAEDTEIYVIDGETDEENDLSRIELEAIAIAGRINELTVSKPLYVYDKAEKSHRRAMYRDIVILLRSTRGVTDVFLDVMKKSGIPVFADSTTGYFDSVEVMTMLSFLQITDNPRQDIQLIAVLRCPVYGLTDDELLEIRGDKKNAVFYDCVREYMSQTCASPLYERAENSSVHPHISQKLTRFLADLDDFRREAVYLPISALIDYIYTATDYFNYAGAMPGGAVRQANLRLLREKAVQYEETSYRGLFHFIAYMQKVMERSDEGGAKAISENANVVRIMTIHKSKGLEFPIVFVSMMGRGFSRQDERGNLILHGGLGIGSVHIDLERRIKSNTLPRMANIIQLRRESMAEELRVMYVAFTRAREKLILTGSVASLAKAREKWERYETGGKFPAHMIFGAGCPLDWVMPVVFNLGNEDSAKIKVHYTDTLELLNGIIAGQERDEKRRADMRDLSKECRVNVRNSLEWSYPLKEFARLPAKLSITEIKRLHNRGQDSAATEYIPDREHKNQQTIMYRPPNFLQTGLTPANRGTVMHTVLEHMDMTQPNSSDDIRELVSGLTLRGILTECEAGLVDYPALDKFCQSDICRRIVAANPDAWRETPFVLGLTPYQIYKRPEFKSIDASILVHGIIDCYFEENGRLVLVDYKTGGSFGADVLLEQYSVQMSIYKLALERATGKEVAECLLYLFAEDRTVGAKIYEFQ